MSENLSKKMKEIVINEDRSGYVIDAVSGQNSAEEIAKNEKKDERKKEERKKEEEEEEVDKSEKTEEITKKKRKVKDKHVKGDSGEESDEEQKKESGEGKKREVVFGEKNVDEIKGGKDRGGLTVQISPSNESQATTNGAQDANQDLPASKRTFSNSVVNVDRRLSLVADTADLRTKLTEAGSNLVVIDFFATWCGPCKMISPKVEELAKEHPDVVFLKVDIDECDEIATEYDVQSMPTFIFIKNRGKIDGFSGANYDKLKETVQKLK